MKAVLDTHALIWMTGNVAQLSRRAREVIEDENLHLHVSVASLWEIAIKQSLGKLTLDVPLPEFFQMDIAANLIEIIPISLSHLVRLGALPHHHRDPFDRMVTA